MSCISRSRDWIDYFIAFAPALVAVLVWVVAYRQLVISRNKLRLDLYERRFAIFERTLAFYQALSGSAESLKTESFSKLQKDFIKSFRESQFLFDDVSGIFPLLDELHKRSYKVTGYKEMKGEISDSATLLEMSNDSNESLAFFAESIKELERKITPYLNFRKVLI